MTRTSLAPRALCCCLNSGAVQYCRPRRGMGETPDTRSDEELMAAYIDGDAAAFRGLFERHAAVLYRLARRRLNSDDDARDVVQQTLLQMHRARNDFRRGSRLRPWLFTIAMNLV